MASIGFIPHPLPTTPLTTSQEDKVAFIREETGIQDSEALKQHIITVQKKAYAVKSFPCIRYFAFAWERISELPAYKEVLKLGRERDNAILLDIGCCYFWDVGHELFRSTPESFPVAFLPGNAVDPAFLKPLPPLGTASQITESPPSLSSLMTLTPLHGHISAIHVSSVFHLLFEAEQTQLAHSLAELLSPLPGSLIFGYHIARETVGLGPVDRNQTDGRRVFCHSPESWVALWEGIFGVKRVKVDVELTKVVISDDDVERSWLTWSVTRV
ncbi:hypothetical protein MSAN_00827100 [Mycena sanguinolenta]|uniref:Uncharacterized protein n=1 Tax=Mycena sanguinolenta TaxID=230812 RepID=A0A8H6YV13_9AGAR|nr:hypothetical protein MSAN_00827100 [Mycena sanguinolenta]